MANKGDYFDSQEFKELLQRYEDDQRHHTNSYFEPDELTDLSEYYYDEEGDRKRAVQILDEAIETFPGAAMPLIFRGRIAMLDEHDTKKARAYARQVDDTSVLDYHYLQAEILLTEGRVDEADSYLRHQLDLIDEDDRPDYVLDVATIYTDYAYFDKAQAWLRLSDEPDLADYKEVEGRIAYSKGNYDQSERIFQKLIDDDPYSTQLWNSLAGVQLMNNRINDAITSSEFSIAINPKDDEAILNKANGLFSLGNYEEALKYYKRFTELCPDEESGYMYQGNTLLNLGKTREAEEQFRMAEMVAPPTSTNLADIYQQIAYTLSAQGQTSNALAYIDKALAIPTSDKPHIHVLRGYILLEQNRVDDAQDCFAKALQMSGNDPKVYFHIGTSAFDCGYTSVAYDMFHALLETDYNDKQTIMPYLTYCCWLLGYDIEFLERLKSSVENDPVEARRVLGDIFPKHLEPEDYYEYAQSTLLKGH